MINSVMASGSPAEAPQTLAVIGALLLGLEVIAFIAAPATPAVLSVKLKALTLSPFDIYGSNWLNCPSVSSQRFR
jgi:hypothetical protein